MGCDMKSVFLKQPQLTPRFSARVLFKAYLLFWTLCFKKRVLYSWKEIWNFNWKTCQIVKTQINDINLLEPLLQSCQTHPQVLCNCHKSSAWAAQWTHLSSNRRSLTLPYRFVLLEMWRVTDFSVTPNGLFPRFSSSFNFLFDLVVHLQSHLPVCSGGDPIMFRQQVQSDVRHKYC